MTTTYNRLKDDQQKELLALIQVSADFATIRTMMYQKFKIIISDTTIDFARKRFMRDTLRTLGIDPGHSSCEIFINSRYSIMKFHYESFTEMKFHFMILLQFR